MSYALINATSAAIPLANGSVDTVITSPPFWGLRSYGTFARVWGGVADCAHGWGAASVRRQRENQHLSAIDGRATHKHDKQNTFNSQPSTGAYCALCGAWRGELGSEPSVEAYVANMVQVARELRRVLTDTGVLLMEIGDSRSNAGHSNNSGVGGRAKHDNGGKPRYTANGSIGEKQLVGVPFRVALALQADGWVWRSWFPWVKRSSMPDSATDRPGDSLSVWLMFTKQPRGYFWDQEAIRRYTGNEMSWEEYQQRTAPGASWKSGGITRYAHTNKKDGGHSHPAGRNYRNTDMYFAALDAEIAEAEARLAELRHLRERGGVRAGDGEMLAIDVSPGGTKAEHYAAYSEKLVTPLIRAACPPSVCSACSKPWRRVVEQTISGQRHISPKDANPDRHDGPETPSSRLHSQYFDYRRQTLGWAPSCTCSAPTRPGRVFDPFAGTGTTLAAAMREGRDGLGCDLSDTYLHTIAAPRLTALEAELEQQAERAQGLVRHVEPDGVQVLAKQAALWEAA